MNNIRYIYYVIIINIMSSEYICTLYNIETNIYMRGITLNL